MREREGKIIKKDLERISQGEGRGKREREPSRQARNAGKQANRAAPVLPPEGPSQTMTIVENTPGLSEAKGHWLGGSLATSLEVTGQGAQLAKGQ